MVLGIKSISISVVVGFRPVIKLIFHVFLKLKIMLKHCFWMCLFCFHCARAKDFGCFGSGSFWPWSFRLWVISALNHLGPVS